MRIMINTFFAVFASVFRTFDLLARSVENVAMCVEGESNAFYQESVVEQKARLVALRDKLGSPEPSPQAGT